MESKTIDKYPNYTIQCNGTVYNSKRDMYLKPLESNGYLYVKLCNDTNSKTFPIHSLVLQYFSLDKTKKKYIKHIDGNKHNNNILNLKYCDFKELLDIEKPRKRALSRKRKVTIKSQVEAYKYYFPDLSPKSIKSCLTFKPYIIENIIILERWTNKGRLNDYEKAFKMLCSGKKKNEIIQYFGWGMRDFYKAINTIRINLINDIHKDVEKGLLIYVPTYNKTKVSIKRPNLSHSLKEWEKYKNEILLNP